MKKGLFVVALGMIVLLVGCSSRDYIEHNRDVTTCVIDEAGMNLVITAIHEDEEIVSAELTVRMPLSDLGITGDVDETSEEFLTLMGMFGFGDNISIDGDQLVVVESGTLYELGIGDSTTITEWIAEAEREGATCR